VADSAPSKPSPSGESSRRAPLVGLVIPLAAALAFLGSPLGTRLDAQAPEPERIASIELRGLSRITEAEVLARMRVRIGDVYDRQELEAEYQRLWRTGDFLFIHDWEAERRADGVHISIRFEEKQKVVEVRLSGMEALSRSRTKEALAIREKELLDPTTLRADREEILRRYAEAGYLFAEVTHETESRPGGVAVVFRIHEGPRVRVREIRFDGAKSFGPGELRDQIRLRERSWFLGIPNSGKLRRDVLFDDAESLRAFYRRKGFFDAQVGAGALVFSEDREWVDVAFVVEEGQRYRVSRVEFEIQGARIFTEEMLLSKLQIGPGKYWDGETITKDAEEIQHLYSDEAYVDATVNAVPIHEISGGDVGLRFIVTEGEKIFIEEVKIRGNEETRDKVIRRQLTFYPGEEFRRDKIQDSVSNLHRIGYFSDVQVAWEAGSQPGLKNIIVDVEEGSTGRMVFGIGLTTGQGAQARFSLQKSNFDVTDLPDSIADIPDAFSGGGQTLTLQAEPGTEYSRYRVQLVEPYLLDTVNSLSLTAYRSAYIRDDYTEERKAGEVTVGRRFLEDRRLLGEVGYRYEVVDIVDIEPFAPPSVFEAEGKTHISSVITGVNYEQRVFRPIIGPVGGWNTRLGYEYAGGPLGAQLDMSKATFAINFYRTVWADGEEDRHIIVFRNDFGWEEEHHDTESIPIFERFYLGGSSTLRGFEFREVGPKENGEPVGGTVRHYGSLEYTFPLYENILRGIGFADYGNLAPDLDSFHGGDYRLAVGGGVLLSIPFLGQYLPISLTWADAVAKEDGDETQSFLFDIGFGF